MSDLDLKVKCEYERVSKCKKKRLKRTSLYLVLLCALSLILLISASTYAWYQMYIINPNNMLDTITMTMDVTLYDTDGNVVTEPNQESTDTNYYTTTDWILNEPSKTKITRYIKLDNTSSVDIDAFLQFYMNYEEGSIGEARYNNIVKTSYFYISNITAGVVEANGIQNYANSYDATISELNAITGKLSMSQIDDLQTLGALSTETTTYYRVEIWSTSSSVTLSSFGMATYIYSRVKGYTPTDEVQTFSVSNESGLKSALELAKSGDIINMASNINLNKPLTFRHALTFNLNGFTLDIEGDLNYDYAAIEDSHLNLLSSSRLNVTGDINVDLPSSSLFINGNSKAQIIVGNEENGIITPGQVSIKTKYDKTQDQSGFVQNDITIQTVAEDAYGNLTRYLADYLVLSNTTIFIGNNCQVGTIYARDASVNFKVVNEGQIESIDTSGISFNSDEYDVDVWDGVSVEAFNGDGTIISPYYIENCAQLKHFANMVNSGNNYYGYHFEVANDLDLNGNEWIPIGNYASASDYFAGTFDANAYLISNFTISQTSAQGYYGLFGYVTGTVKNLGVVDYSIDIIDPTTATVYAGVVAGVVYGGSVNGCYSIGNNDIIASGVVYAGGLVGLADSNASIQNCYSLSPVTAQSDLQCATGGIIGKIASGLLANTYSETVIIGKNTSTSPSFTGGLVGENVGEIRNSYSSSTTSGYSISSTSGTGATYTGGLAGYNQSLGVINNCYTYGNTTATANANGTSSASGGLVGYNSGEVNYSFAMGNVTASAYAASTSFVGGIIGYNTGEITVCYRFNEQVITDTGAVIVGDNSLGTIGSEIWIMANLVQPYWRIYGEGSIPNGYVWWVRGGMPLTLYYQNVTSYTITIADNIWRGNTAIDFGGGEGTAEIPYEISTGAHLSLLRDNVNSGTDYNGVYFIIANNIDLSGLEWEPIGLNSTYDFAGNIDGGGFKIFNFIINEKYNGYYGLFGYMSGGRITDLTVTNINYTISATSNSYIGGLIGYANSVYIKNCEVKGGIILDNALSIYAGALIGYANGTSANRTIVNRVDAGVTIDVESTGSSSTSVYAGGFIGYATYLSVIYSDSTGNVDSVSSQGANYSGGFIGYLTNGLIQYSYSNCIMDARSKSSTCAGGGFIGHAVSSTISGCYANVQSMVRAASTLYSGGFVAYLITSSNINNCYSVGEVRAMYDGSSINATYAGGLVGYNNSGCTITKCYSRVDAYSLNTGDAAYAGGLIAYNNGILSYSYSYGMVTARGKTKPISYVGGAVGSTGSSANTSNTGVYRWEEQFLTCYTEPNTSSANPIGIEATLTTILSDLVMVSFLAFDSTNTNSVDDGYVWFKDETRQPYLFHEIVDMIDEEDVDKYNTAVLIGGSYERNKYQIFILNRGLIGLNNTSDSTPVLIMSANSNPEKAIVMYVLDKYSLSYSSSIYYNSAEFGNRYPIEQRVSGALGFTYLEVQYIIERDETDIDYTDDGEEDTAYNSATDTNGNIWKFIALEDDTAKVIGVTLYDETITSLAIPNTLAYRDGDYLVTAIAAETINADNIGDITQIIIGANAKAIEVNAFAGAQISSIVLDSNNTTYTLFGSFDDSNLTLMSYDTQTICEVFAQNGAITEYQFPISTQKVKYDAFKMVPTITDYIIPTNWVVMSSVGTFNTNYTVVVDELTGNVSYVQNGITLHVIDNTVGGYESHSSYRGYSAGTIQGDMHFDYLDGLEANIRYGSFTLHYYGYNVAYGGRRQKRTVTFEGDIATIYFVNNRSWSTVYCFSYLDDYVSYSASRTYDAYLNGPASANSNTAQYYGSGREMEFTGKYYNSYPVYSIDMPVEQSCVFYFNEDSIYNNYRTEDCTYEEFSYIGGSGFIPTATSGSRTTVTMFNYQVESSVTTLGMRICYELVDVEGELKANIIYGLSDATNTDSLSFPSTVTLNSVAYPVLQSGFNDIVMYCYSATNITGTYNYFYYDDYGKMCIWH